MHEHLITVTLNVFAKDAQEAYAAAKEWAFAPALTDTVVCVSVNRQVLEFPEGEDTSAPMIEHQIQ